MNKLLAIRKEYGKAFVDVVRDYAQMGCSRKLTASILGLSLRYFMRLIQRFHLGGYFKPIMEMTPDCRGVGHPNKKGWPKGKPQRRLPKISNEQLFEEIRKYPFYGSFSAFAIMSMSTVEHRFGRWTTARAMALGFLPNPSMQATGKDGVEKSDSPARA